MKEAYDSTPKEERGNNLVPEKTEYLKNPPISGNSETGQRYEDPNYKWPNNGGFEGKPTEITPKEGQQFDRLGNEQGRFVAPIDDGQVQLKENRGLPYHFVENNITDEPSYHQYEVVRDFDQLKDSINEFNNPDLTPDENDEMRDIFMEDYNRNTRPSDTYTHEPGKTYDGQIADAFEEDDGGGSQWELPMSVESLKQLGMIKEL
nr:glycohydrolase toxin TNT-related protein [Clostridium senegalense]